MKSTLPTMLLEDFDELLREVVCHRSEIALRFSSNEILTHAWQELHTHEPFLIITSHDGCSSNGERETYM